MKKTTIVKISLLIFLLFKSSIIYSSTVIHITSVNLPNIAAYYIDTIDETLMTPNPCYKENNCFFGVASADYSSSGGSSAIHNKVDAFSFKTMGEVAKKFMAAYGNRGSFLLSANDNKNPNNICGAFLFATDKGEIYFHWPDMICRKLPPIDLKCQTSGIVDMNYNSILIPDVNNAKKNVNISITCNMDTQIRVSASGSPGIEDIQLKNDGSLVAKMSVNDKRGIIGDVISVKKDQSEVIKISSVLVQSGKIEAGPFHGSGVLQVFFE